MKAARLIISFAIAGLIILALPGCECMKCCSSTKPGEPEAVKTVKVDKLAEMVRMPGTAIIVDARNWQPGMEIIPGSANIKDGDTDAYIAKALPNKSTMVVTYCANTRCTASPMLAKRLVKLGYTNVWEYPEGIAGWKAAGKAVDTVSAIDVTK